MNLGMRLFKKKRESAPLAARYPHYQIGVGSYGKIQIHDFGEGTTLQIGNYCSLADEVQIMLGGGHRADWVTIYPFSALDTAHRHIKGHPVSRGDVRIGHDVWIGREAMILSGVTIGNGAVIGARAVVARDVAPYAVVVGNPAREIRKRFDENTVTRLEALAWWHWPRVRIDAVMPLLLNTDIRFFLDAAERGEI